MRANVDLYNVCTQNPVVWNGVKTDGESEVKTSDQA